MGKKTSEKRGKLFGVLNILDLIILLFLLSLGAAARARFEQTFTAQVFARQTDSLYRKLVTGCEWE